jgi:hypothetical protein
LESKQGLGVRLSVNTEYTEQKSRSLSYHRKNKLFHIWEYSNQLLSSTCFGQYLDPFKLSKILQDSPSHRIFRRMYGALNVDKKITNCTVCL